MIPRISKKLEKSFIVSNRKLLNIAADIGKQIG